MVVHKAVRTLQRTREIFPAFFNSTRYEFSVINAISGGMYSTECHSIFTVFLGRYLLTINSMGFYRFRQALNKYDRDDHSQSRKTSNRYTFKRAPAEVVSERRNASGAAGLTGV